MSRIPDDRDDAELPGDADPLTDMLGPSAAAEQASRGILTWGQYRRTFPHPNDDTPALTGEDRERLAETLGCDVEDLEATILGLDPRDLDGPDLADAN